MQMTINTEVLQNYIKDNNMTAKQFCKLCGISQQQYNKIMTTHCAQRFAVLKIALIAGLAIDAIVADC